MTALELGIARPGRPAPEGLTKMRAMIRAAPPFYPAEAAISVGWAELGGVKAIVAAPEHHALTIVYFHGGGYRQGHPEPWGSFGARLAALTGARVILPTYRLAPEHPFPAALIDGAAVLRAVAGGADALVLAGDSAGGGLATALTAWALTNDVAPIAALLLYSPWVDLTVSADSYATCGDRDRMFSRTAATEAAADYLQGHEATDPLPSPLFADHRGFPPTLIFAGLDEVLLDDSLALSARLARAGVTVEGHYVAGMQHVWPVIFADLPESREALGATRDFVARMVRTDTARATVPA